MANVVKEMTDPVKEQLSACLDGELPEDELDLLLKRLGRDPQLRQAMGSYSLIGEALRAERPVTASSGFAAKVSAAIAAEPSGQPQPSRSSPRFVPPLRWLQPAAGMAIAAGVAALAISLLQPETATEPVQVAQETGAALTESAAGQSSYTVPTNTAPTAFVPAARLTNYVVAHSEYSSPLGRRTVLSGVLSEEADAEAADAGSDTEAQLPADVAVVTQP